MAHLLRILYSLCLCLWLLPFVFSDGIHCRDEENQAVDWFVAIKLPHLKQNKNPKVQKGEAYIFITSSSESKNWTLSDLSVRDSKSIMGNTLKPLYSGQSSTFARILYNDQPPHGNTTLTLGHTKGVVLGDSKSGLWLIHSVPHFPPEASSNVYSYPNTGVIYGQSFLCISTLPKELEMIGQQLLYNEPYVYDAGIPVDLQNLMPSLARAAEGEHIHSSPWFSTKVLSSAGGQSFTTFAKSKNFGKDLYADWVAQELREDLLVETWNHGPGAKMESVCGKPFKVENVEAVSMDTFSYKTSEDHSKWAVASGKRKPWTCIGDINRMEHQKQRGGGTVCFQNNHVFSSFQESVINLDVCPHRN